jgi:hypothetical protein
MKTFEQGLTLHGSRDAVDMRGRMGEGVATKREVSGVRASN